MNLGLVNLGLVPIGGLMFDGLRFGDPRMQVSQRILVVRHSKITKNIEILKDIIHEFKKFRLRRAATHNYLLLTLVGSFLVTM